MMRCLSYENETMPGLNGDILKLAYSNGFFPMPHPETEEICWFNPDPRAIIPLERFHVSRSLKRKINKRIFTVTMDYDFAAVIHSCANREETWINDEIIQSYSSLFEEGIAHSVEVWNGAKLVGGLYGVSLGMAFFAESMFHTESDASKVALWALVEKLRQENAKLLEVQFITQHLKSLGAIAIPNLEYMGLLAAALQGSINLSKQSLDFFMPPGK